MTGAQSWDDASDDEPIFITWGTDGQSLRCRVCGTVDGVVQDETPSMAGYGEDTYTRCSRCGSVELSDPIFGWRAKPAAWPPAPQQEQAATITDDGTGPDGGTSADGRTS
jgi:hypothetical protein